MYSTCLFCNKDLGTNEVLETLPIGRRLAFDAAQGRLWVVCRHCGKWNLVPFDTRLETIDACEGLFHDTRTRFSTDHIGIARLKEGMELVRIGPALRPEFASWRYGAQYRRRRRQTLIVAGAGAAAGAAVLIGANVAGIVAGGTIGGLWQLPRLGWKFVRHSRRRVVTTLPDASGPVTLKHKQLMTAHLDLSGREMRLRFRRPGAEPGTLVDDVVTGEEMRLLTRRVTGALNDMVGSDKHLRDAVARLESHRMEDWLASQVKPWSASGRSDWRGRGIHWTPGGSQVVRLASLPDADRLAVEMWLSEEDEAKALAGELTLLEHQWREAEKLAKIADALAVPDDVEREINRRHPG